MKAKDAIADVVELIIDKEYGKATWEEITGANMVARVAIMFEAEMTETEASDHLRRQTLALLATRKCQCTLINEFCTHHGTAVRETQCNSHYEADVPPAGPGKLMLCGTCYCALPDTAL